MSLGKELIVTAALATTVTAMLSARAQADPAPELKLVVWINSDKGYTGLQKVGDAFAEKSGVKVVVEHPVDAPDKFSQAAGAGKGPDIFCWPHDRVGEWAKSGLIAPVRPGKKLEASVEASAWEAFAYHGKTWGYPIAIEAIGLIYNKSFFSWPMLAGAGGQIFPKDAKGDFDPSKVGVNNAGAVKGGEMLERMIKGGVMPKGARYAEMEGGFARGEVAMMISGPFAWDNARRARIDFGVAPIPAVIPGQPSKPFVGVLGCMIAAPSKLKDIAREFIENHLMQVDSLRIINADVPLGVPANKKFYAELAADPAIRATMENARLGQAIPNIPEVGRFWTAMDAALEAISNGLQSPKDALDGAAARMLVGK